MIQLKKKTKSQQIIETFLDAMNAGVLVPGSRIESVREIGARFDASLSVVNNALNYLEQQGRIIRRPRSGVFVKAPDHTRELLNDSVLVCMPLEGHVWGTLFSLIVRALNQRGLSAITVHSDMLMTREPTAELSLHIHELIHDRLRGAIVMGCDYWKNPFLSDYSRNKIVFIFELDYPEICGNGVLVDYEAAYHAMTTHLIETGRRRIAFMVPPEAMREGQRRMVHFNQMCNGYERALREHDLTGNCRYLTEFDGNDLRSIRAYLADIMNSSLPPDAIMCYMDAIAMRIIKAAHHLKIAVPRELAVTGFYHTPWADFAPLPLTTARFDLDAMAKKAVEILLTEQEVPQIIYVKPELRLEASSVALDTNK